MTGVASVAGLQSKEERWRLCGWYSFVDFQARCMGDDCDAILSGKEKRG